MTLVPSCSGQLAFAFDPRGASSHSRRNPMSGCPLKDAQDSLRNTLGSDFIHLEGRGISTHSFFHPHVPFPYCDLAMSDIGVQLLIGVFVLVGHSSDLALE
jgi:hypothetical protein